MKAIVKDSRKIIDVEWYDSLPDGEGGCFNVYRDCRNGIPYTEFELELIEYQGG